MIYVCLQYDIYLNKYYFHMLNSQKKEDFSLNPLELYFFPLILQVSTLMGLQYRYAIELHHAKTGAKSLSSSDRYTTVTKVLGILASYDAKIRPP